MRQIAEFIAVLACGLFAGAAVYVSLVEHPARMECGIEIATAEFPPSYHRGTIMQVTLAALGLLSSIAAWLVGATFWWLIAGILLVIGSGDSYRVHANERSKKTKATKKPHIENREWCEWPHDGSGVGRAGLSRCSVSQHCIEMWLNPVDARPCHRHRSLAASEARK